MAGRKPRPATVEDYDESRCVIVPDSQQVANTGAKVVPSRLDQRFPEPLIDGASDSGYSSRTAATVNSTQSVPSGERSPPAPHKSDQPKRSSDLVRKSSHRDRKDKDRAARPQEEKMSMAAYPGSAHHHSHAGRSPSKSRRHDSYLRTHPDAIYYEGGSPYHPSTPVDSRAMDYPPPSAYRPPIPDFHPAHIPSHYPPAEEYHSSRSSRPHSGSYQSMYHRDPRPGPWAVALPRGYSQQQMPYAQYDHPPPPPSGVWQQGSYPSSPYGAPPNFGQEQYGHDSMYNYAPHPRERSESRPRESTRHRRSSVYGPPPSGEDVFPEWEDDSPEHYYAPRQEYREKPRGRASVPLNPDYDDSDRRRMPPPPPPVPSKQRPPQVHQQKRPEARKIQSAAAVPSSQQRRSSRAFEKGFEMDDLMDSLREVEYGNRRAPRELPAPDRSHSLRGSRRSTSYNDGSRSGARVAVASSGRRRRPETYYPEDRHSMLADQEDLEREAERYQALRAGRPATAQLPASHETLMSKLANGAGSDSGSRKSGSNSSGGSATKTEKEARNMTLSLNGMSIAFGDECLSGKSISIRTGEQGATQLNITDGTERPKRPKPYVQGSAYSDHTGGSGRRVLESGRRTRDGRPEKSVHRSSRSGYSRSQRYET